MPLQSSLDLIPQRIQRAGAHLKSVISGQSPQRDHFATRQNLLTTPPSSPLSSEGRTSPRRFLSILIPFADRSSDARIIDFPSTPEPVVNLSRAASIRSKTSGSCSSKSQEDLSISNSTHSESSHSLAPKKRAADAQKGSSDVEEKRKKNRRVEEVKKLVRDHDAGRRLANQDVSCRTLYLGEYRQLLADVERDGDLKTIFETDLRYDYTADNRGKNNKRLNQFVVRMPTAFHELLSESIDDFIKEWRFGLKAKKAQCTAKLCSGPKCADCINLQIAQRLKGYRSTSVANSDLAEADKKDPDLSYKYEEKKDKPRYPGLVVEVGWSQRSDDLEKKCKWYIEKSNGETRTVIGVDLNDLYLCYPKPKTKPHGPSEDENTQAIDKDVADMATNVKKKKALGKIYVWRAEVHSGTHRAKAILDNDCPKIFRDENGEAVGEEILRDENGEKLGEVAFHLSLEDFMSAKVSEQVGASRNPVLAVVSNELCERFDTALRDQIQRDRKQEEADAKKKDEEQRRRTEESRPQGRAQEGPPLTPTAQILTEAPVPTLPNLRILGSRIRRRISGRDDGLVRA
ncbi:hypothetical protein F4680DRAFT_439719 [Xylaria scruposa]|nr:hypothetical protein F4680DRAFT_439719 [Xylaria scruposa]